MKNRWIRAALSLVAPCLPKHPAAGRILAVSTTALGDTLWATPALENIRRSFPESYLAVLTSPVGTEVLKHNPWVDRTFVLKEPLSSSFFALWKTLYREKFDTVLLFHASQRLALPLCALLGAARIVGTSGINKGLDALLTDPLPNHFQHEIVRRLKIAERIGAEPHTETLSYFVQPEERLAPKTDARPWIALHPGSKDAFKRWPAENFSELGRLLKQKLDCEIWVTGSREEKNLMEQVAAGIPNARLSDPAAPLRSFAARLEQMDLLICNDTGPFHLACALKRPVLGIYCSTNPSLCGPYKAERAAVLSKRAACDPCLKRKCHSPFCFLQFGAAEVADLALASLSKKL